MKKPDEYLTRDTWLLQNNHVPGKRQKFEAWAKEKGFGNSFLGFRLSGHCYHDGELENLWRAWQEGGK